MSQHRRYVIAVLLVLLSACADNGQSPEISGTTTQIGQGSISKELIAAAAVVRFTDEYGGNVEAATVVVVPGDYDIEAIAVALGNSKEVTTEPPSGNYWEVIGVTESVGYWKVELASINGEHYFSGPLFFRTGPDGSIERVDPEDVGEVAVTSVS